MSISIDKCLPETIFWQVLTHVGPLETLVASVACKYFKQCADNDLLWKQFLKNDYPKEEKGAAEVNHRNIYLKCFKKKFIHLNAWINAFNYGDKISLQQIPLKQIREELCDLLFDVYFNLMHQEYSHVGRVLALANTGSFPGLPQDFSFDQIEEEHCEVVIRLLNKAIESDKKLEIHFDRNVEQKVLQPLHIKILTQFFDSLIDPIEISFTDVSFKNLFFLYPLIQTGKIRSLKFSLCSHINAKERTFLRERAIMPGSKLIALEIENEKINYDLAL